MIDHRFLAVSKLEKIYFIASNFSIFTLLTTNMISLNIIFLGARDSSLIQLVTKIADYFSVQLYL